MLILKERLDREPRVVACLPIVSAKLRGLQGVSGAPPLKQHALACSHATVGGSRPFHWPPLRRFRRVRLRTVVQFIWKFSRWFGTSCTWNHSWSLRRY